MSIVFYQMLKLPSISPKHHLLTPNHRFLNFRRVLHVLRTCESRHKGRIVLLSGNLTKDVRAKSTFKGIATLAEAVMMAVSISK